MRVTSAGVCPLDGLAVNHGGNWPIVKAIGSALVVMCTVTLCCCCEGSVKRSPKVGGVSVIVTGVVGSGGAGPTRSDALRNPSGGEKMAGNPGVGVGPAPLNRISVDFRPSASPAGFAVNITSSGDVPVSAALSHDGKGMEELLARDSTVSRE